MFVRALTKLILIVRSTYTLDRVRDSFEYSRSKNDRAATYTSTAIERGKNVYCVRSRGSSVYVSSTLLYDLSRPLIYRERKEKNSF